MSDDLEATRLRGLEAAKESFDGDLSGFAPGTMGCHEAFHVASIFCDDVYQRLAEHPAVVLNPDWYRLATEAGDKLFELYQAIGSVHLADTPTAIRQQEKP